MSRSRFTADELENMLSLNISRFRDYDASQAQHQHDRNISGFADQATSQEWGISDQYIILDSFQKSETSDISNGELRFNLAVQGGGIGEVVGINDQLNDIIEMEIFKFFLPSVPLLPFRSNDIADVNGIPQQLPDSQLPRLTVNTEVPEVINTIGSAQSMACFGGKLALLIRELDAQSTVGLNGVRFHWELETELSAFLTNVSVVPSIGREIFTFTRPIRDVSGMTLILRNPDVPIMLTPDVLYGVTPRIATNADTNEPVLEFYIADQNHDILAGDRIFIATSNIADGESDPLWIKYDRWLNDPNGHLVGIDGSTSVDPNLLQLGVVTPSTIRLNPDLNLKDIVYSNDTKYTVGMELKSFSRINIYLAKNRIRIPIRMRKVVPYTTNYKEA